MFQKPKFKERDIDWCDLCETFIVICDKCRGTNCNCMSCIECSDIQKEFDALHPWPEFYLSDEERKTVKKYSRIKQLLKRCLSEGKPLDYQWLKDEGALCGNDWELLDLKISKYEEKE